MHGIIFTSFQEFARQELGALDDERSYLPDRAYPDEEFGSLVATAAAASGLDHDELLRRYGRFAGMTAFARLYPEFYAESRGTRAFLLRIEERIHELVRATIPGATPPRLRVTALGDEGVVVSYTSDRQLCAMLEGLVEGVGAYYGERFRLTHDPCMHKGDLACAVLVEPA